MAYKTDIEWCDMTWNPVTGCLHGCKYCYARGIARRFAAKETPDPDSLFTSLYRADGICELGEPVRDDDGKILPFPNGFTPTFHHYRLNEPAKRRKPCTIFVGSMCDMFGSWVADKWIKDVFEATNKAPQHRYLFLTKNSKRYLALQEKGLLHTGDNMWYGTTVNNTADFLKPCRAYDLHLAKYSAKVTTFLSIEPLLSEIVGIGLKNIDLFDWIIIGAETGNRKRQLA